MHRACGQDHRQRRTIGIDVGVGQHDVQAATAHRLFGFVADAVKSLAHGVAVIVVARHHEQRHRQRRQQLAQVLVLLR